MRGVIFDKDSFEDVDAGETARTGEEGGDNEVKGECMRSRFPVRTQSEDLPEFWLDWSSDDNKVSSISQLTGYELVGLVVDREGGMCWRRLENLVASAIGHVGAGKTRVARNSTDCMDLRRRIQEYMRARYNAVV